MEIRKEVQDLESDKIILEIPITEEQFKDYYQRKIIFRNVVIKLAKFMDIKQKIVRIQNAR